MLRKKLTYVDFAGNERTEEFRFNLTEAELMRLETSLEGGLKETLERMIEAQDAKEIMRFFERIIMMAYGEMSEDGRHFRKGQNGEKAADFKESAAYAALFRELIASSEAAAAFFNGIVPKVPSKGQSEKAQV